MSNFNTPSRRLIARVAFAAFLLPLSCIVYATDYYVSVNDGSNNNPGTELQPFATIQHAHDQTLPGDTVYVKNGVYSTPNGGPALLVRRSGREGAWITYRNYPGHRPKVTFTTWGGIQLWDTSYIEINGFEVEGNLKNIDFNFADSQKRNDINETNGTGIGLYKPYNEPFDENKPWNHHIRIRNNIIHDIPGNGISSVGSDYLFIENNLVYRAGWYARWGMSGISTYEPRNLDNRRDVYRHIIRGNISHSNYNYFECYCTNFQSVSDGNGIIVDDGKHQQNDPADAYNGRVLVSNNVVFNNGARGINVYLTDDVDVFNNTSFANLHHPDITGGEVSIGDSSNARVFNNIAFARGANYPIQTFGNNTGNQFDYNLRYGGGQSSQRTSGPNDVTNVDPLLKVIPTFKSFGKPPRAFGLFDDTEYHEIADFSLPANSPAVDRGRALSEVTRDILGKSRPSGSTYDIGAYEREVASETPKVSVNPATVTEGSGVVSIKVTLNVAAGRPVKVVAATARASAINGQDFYGNTETLEFAAGEVAKEFNVVILDDNLSESDEEFFLRAISVEGAVIDQARAAITIKDDDNGETPQFAIKDVIVIESAGQAIVPIALSAVSSSVIRVELATDKQSAQPGADYYGSYRIIEFQPGETQKTFAIDVIDDTQTERGETFIARLFNAQGALIVPFNDRSTITITDND